jgi:hypothetical protein
MDEETRKALDEAFAGTKFCPKCGVESGPFWYVDSQDACTGCSPIESGE